MAALVDKYSLNGVVKYVEFESKLSGLVDAMTAGGEMAVPGGGLGSLRPEEATALGELLEELRTQVANRRLLLTPAFQDLTAVARARHGRPVQAGALDDGALQVGAAPPCCSRRTPRPRPPPPQGFVNYRRFVATSAQRVAERAARAARRLASGASRSASSVLSAVAEGKPALSITRRRRPPRSARAACGRCARRARVRAPAAVRLKEVFRDDDKLRKGLVTRAQFYRELATAVRGFDFTPSEIGALEDEDAEPQVLDPQGAPWVKWVVFVGDVDRVFTLDDLEKRPTLDVEVEVVGARGTARRRVRCRSAAPRRAALTRRATCA